MQRALASSRMVWMDLLRGIAVVLVVFNHAVKFTADSFIEPPELAVVLNEVLAPARMPLMVFLSGLLLQRSLAKGPRRHVIGKVKAVLYPFAVWTILILGYEAASDLARGRGLNLLNPLDVLLAPPGHVWFLEYLFIFYLVALLVPVVPSWALATAGLVACAVLPHEWDRFFLLFAFFFLGHVAGTHQPRLDALASDRRALIAAGVVALGLPVLAISRIDLRYDVLSAPFVVAVILLAIRFGRAVAGTSAAAPFEFAGRLSLVFYLGHWFPTLAAVLATQAALPAQPYVAVVVGLAAGLGISWILAQCYERFAFVRAFFAWPDRKVSVRRDSA